MVFGGGRWSQYDDWKSFRDNPGYFRFFVLFLVFAVNVGFLVLYWKLKDVFVFVGMLGFDIFVYCLMKWLRKWE